MTDTVENYLNSDEEGDNEGSSLLSYNHCSNKSVERTATSRSGRLATIGSQRRKRKINPKKWAIKWLANKAEREKYKKASVKTIRPKQYDYTTNGQVPQEYPQHEVDYQSIKGLPRFGVTPKQMNTGLQSETNSHAMRQFFVDPNTKPMEAQSHPPMPPLMKAAPPKADVTGDDDLIELSDSDSESYSDSESISERDSDDSMPPEADNEELTAKDDRFAGATGTHNTHTAASFAEAPIDLKMNGDKTVTAEFGSASLHGNGETHNQTENSVEMHRGWKGNAPDQSTENDALWDAACLMPPSTTDPYTNASVEAQKRSAKRKRSPEPDSYYRAMGYGDVNEMQRGAAERQHNSDGLQSISLVDEEISEIIISSPSSVEQNADRIQFKEPTAERKHNSQRLQRRSPMELDTIQYEDSLATKPTATQNWPPPVVEYVTATPCDSSPAASSITENGQGDDLATKPTAPKNWPSPVVEYVTATPCDSSPAASGITENGQGDALATKPTATKNWPPTVVEYVTASLCNGSPHSLMEYLEPYAANPSMAAATVTPSPEPEPYPLPYPMSAAKTLAYYNPSLPIVNEISSTNQKPERVDRPFKNNANDKPGTFDQMEPCPEIVNEISSTNQKPERGDRQFKNNDQRAHGERFSLEALDRINTMYEAEVNKKLEESIDLSIIEIERLDEAIEESAARLNRLHSMRNEQNAIYRRLKNLSKTSDGNISKTKILMESGKERAMLRIKAEPDIDNAVMARLVRKCGEKSEMPQDFKVSKVIERILKKSSYLVNDESQPVYPDGVASKKMPRGYAWPLMQPEQQPETQQQLSERKGAMLGPIDPMYISSPRMTGDETVYHLHFDNEPEVSRSFGKCHMCEVADAIFLCVRCRQQWYCSRDCQLNHWRTHVDECVPYEE